VFVAWTSPTEQSWFPCPLSCDRVASLQRRSMFLISPQRSPHRVIMRMSPTILHASPRMNCERVGVQFLIDVSTPTSYTSLPLGSCKIRQPRWMGGCHHQLAAGQHCQARHVPCQVLCAVLHDRCSSSTVAACVCCRRHLPHQHGLHSRWPEPPWCNRRWL